MSWLVYWMAHSHLFLYTLSSLSLSSTCYTVLLLWTVNEVVPPPGKKSCFIQIRKEIVALFDHTHEIFDLFYRRSISFWLYSLSSHMCRLCLTLPPLHSRWYNGCYESSSHFQDGQNRSRFPKLVKRERRNTAGHCPSDSMTPLI